MQRRIKTAKRSPLPTRTRSRTPTSRTSSSISFQALVLPGSVTFTNTGTAHGGVNYTFTGNAIGGTTGITLSGTGGVGGTVTFTKPNSFNGEIAINAGELIAANATALGNASGTTVASGAALQLSGGFTYAATGTSTLPLTLSGAGYASSPAGALDSEGGNNAYPGAITLGSAATINSGTTSDTLALSGGIATTTNDLAFTGTGNITIATKGITSTDTGEPQSSTTAPAH